MLNDFCRTLLSDFLALLSNTLDPGFVQSVVLYGSGTSDAFIPNESDLDLMVVVDVESGHINTHQVQKLYGLHSDFVRQAQFPLSLYVYGIDEIPTNQMVGYNLLRTLFIFDYKSEAMVLFGRDIIREMPVPNSRLAAVQLVNDFKRGLRVSIAKSPYMSDETELRRLIGDRAGNTVHFTQDICETIDNLVRWSSYCSIMAAKCALAYEGEFIAGKNKIGARYLEGARPDKTKLFTPVYDWWIRHKSKDYERWNLREPSIAVTSVVESQLIVINALQFVEAISFDLEQRYFQDNQVRRDAS